MFEFTLSFIAWAIVHSVTAATIPKAWIRRKMGEAAYEGLYRLIYNLFATVTFLPVLFLLATRVPETLLWSATGSYLWLARAFQLVGILGLILSLFQTDIWEFAGIKQALRYLSRTEDAARPSKLVTKGAYALVRHPLYLFSLIVLWFNPVVRIDTLVFNLLSTLYFWMGSRYEERRLSAHFGVAYREYQQRVPYLLPVRLRWKKEGQAK